MEQDKAVELLHAASKLLEQSEHVDGHDGATPPSEIARELLQLADDLQKEPAFSAESVADAGAGSPDGSRVGGTLRARMAAAHGRVDRVLAVPGEGHLPVSVDTQEPLELVGVGFDDEPIDSEDRTWALHLELHNPSQDAYTAEATLVFRNDAGDVLSKEVFIFSAIDSYESGSQRQTIWIPPDADTVMLRVTAVLDS